MKVGIFTETYNQINGVTRTLSELNKYAVKKGHELSHIVVRGLFNCGDKTWDDGGVTVYEIKPIISIPITRKGEYWFAPFPPNSKALKICEKEDFDVIHSTSAFAMGYSALHCSERLGVPIVASYHTSIPEYIETYFDNHRYFGPLYKGIIGRLSAGIVERMMLPCLERPEILMAPSEDIAKDLEEKLNREVKIWSRGIDTKKFNPNLRSGELRERYNIGEENILLYVGRISKEKNLSILAEIWEEVKDSHLIFVGDGPYRKRLERKFKERVTFVGYVNNDEVLAKIYASSDIFVFPSTTDTLGNVVLEALASGLPAIVSDVGGPKEIIKDGETGFITMGMDTKDFLEKLNILIEGKELRKKMGKRARGYAKTRSWDAVFEGLFDLYASVVR